jgi:transketolase
MSIQNLTINSIRTLGIDAINKANSGHPGMVLGAAPMAYSLYANHLHVNPNNSEWFDRDRFVLSAGHGSMLLYSLLHLSGFDVTMEDLKNFRQWDSRTPGHPEYGHTQGVDATGGPLGQGLSMGVGMAVTESFLAEKFNKEDATVVDHFTYVLCGDGDLQEGVTQEAMSLAGHLGLGKLVVLYDSNDIQLDGPVEWANSEDVKAKYESMNWHYERVEDGTDVAAINAAIEVAKNETNKPTIIEIKTVIGFGSPLAGDSGSHGAPLGEEKGQATKEALGWTYDAFTVPTEVYDHMKEVVADRGASKEAKWLETVEAYKTNYPEDAKLFDQVLNNEFEIDFASAPTFEAGVSEATRNTSGKVINTLSESFDLLIGGSADLTKSTKAKGLNGDFSRTNRLGRNINFGVREHAMAAMVNGMMLHKGVKAFTGAFFVFSDYLKPSLRLAALMNIPSIFVFTHDSIAVGEDGPTHEPIEQLAGLRSIPNFDVIRPGDATETVAAWQLALESTKTPTALVLTRQNLTAEANTSYEGVKKGGYVVSAEQNKVDAIIIAAGSEVNLAIATQKELLENGIDVRVVSIPSFKRFNEQSAEYREEVLPSSVRARVGVEMGASLGWHQYVGLDGRLLTIDRFGASAPGGTVIEKYGFTVENLSSIVSELVK